MDVLAVWKRKKNSLDFALGLLFMSSDAIQRFNYSSAQPVEKT